jgi:hypothetical protein
MSRDDRDFRREKRVAFTTHAALSPVSGSGGRIEDASTIDFSESGVRLRLRGQIEPGQIVELFLSKRPERCRVVWTDTAGPKTELVAGLEFMYPLPDPRHRLTPPSSKFETVI